MKWVCRSIDTVFIWNKCPPALANHLAVENENEMTTRVDEDENEG